MSNAAPAAPAAVRTPAAPAAPAGTKRVGASPLAASVGATAVPAAPAVTGAVAGAAPVTEVKRGGGIARNDFDFRTAVNADGTPAWREVEGKTLLTAFPSNYDVRKYRALEKDNFTADQNGEASFYDYKAAVAENMRSIYEKSVEDYRTQATNVRKYGNSDQRKLANKAAAMVTEFQAMLDQMRKEGVDTTDLERMLAVSAAKA